MERMYGIAAITSVCILVILIGVLKKNAEVLLNFAARTVVCFLCSHFLNSFFLAHTEPLVSVEWQHFMAFYFYNCCDIAQREKWHKKEG